MCERVSLPCVGCSSTRVEPPLPRPLLIIQRRLNEWEMKEGAREEVDDGKQTGLR